jgi:tetratricopeptide (TPR) repeat protein
MKRLILFSALLIVYLQAVAQQHEKPLLGYCAARDLEQAPYSEWYKPNYQAYQPRTEIIEQIKKLGPEKFTIRILFGTWCGDSKREVPRMMKILTTAGFPEKNIQLLGLYDSLDVYKQGPKREEKGLNVYRVPTFIVYQKDKELGRIVEYAVESLERDLLKILSGHPYTHNYKSFSKINTWLAQGVLSDENINPRGLAEQVKTEVSRESDLNSCGYVLLMRKDVKEAITVFRININLFPLSPNCFDSLGEAYLVAGNKENSKACYERVLELDPQNENAKNQLAKIKDMK